MSGPSSSVRGGAPPRWGYQTSFWQPRQPAFWLFVASVSFASLIAAGQQLTLIEEAPAAWLATVLLLVPYAVPAILVIYLLDLYEREPPSILAAALVWGGVVATTLSIYTNTPLEELIFKVTADPAFTSEWGAALTAPLVEELFKGLGIVLLVSLARAEMDDVMDGFVWGAMVGIGFLLVEDVFYFVRAYASAGSSFDTLFHVFLVRVVGAGPYSHFLYTGLVGMGIAYDTTRSDVLRGRRLLVSGGFMAAGVAAHFFWNSPLLGELLGDGDLAGWATYMTAKGLPMLIGLLLLVRLARGRERRWFERLVGAGVEDGTITVDELDQLGSLRGRWRARRAATAALGREGGRLRGQIQRQQVNLAMATSRVGRADHPDVLAQRERVRALKAQYAALLGARVTRDPNAGDAGHPRG